MDFFTDIGGEDCVIHCIAIVIRVGLSLNTRKREGALGVKLVIYFDLKITAIYLMYTVVMLHLAHLIYLQNPPFLHCLEYLAYPARPGHL